ncbi:hypothetical protein [Roseateles violae]|uniref:Lipid/polyisoprenoid-binding YceI-like domain-containing protein n=1 Tax=Roseateles violae TaxID=3058042 RepID=A0ABT8DPH7_9BURK|nr:hypothetical protein [Pelomonas sp. PFR6]MDN3919913.1 hypothetical protein [Pelomonas sp. PFR6]
MAIIRLPAFPRPRLLLLLLSVLLLAGCAAAPLPAPAPDAAADEPLSQRYARLQREQGGRLYRLDAAQSAVRIHVFRAGRAAQLGHNHVLAAPRLEGLAWLPATGLAGARFELELRLAELALDPPELRAALGPGWASAISPEMVAATRANMLGDGNLQAGAFPLLRLRSLQVVGELPKLAAQIEIELHGQRRCQWLALQAERSEAGLAVRGALALLQSEFGIAPFSVGAGLLAVQDALTVEFDLRLQTGPGW